MPLRKLWRKRYKLNNRGSAIVTVIVVTLFITILATTLLFVSGRNYIMKQTDYQNTKSFYTAEETLDKLKELLVPEVDEAFDVAYRDMMRNYASFTSEEQRFAYYADSFTTYLDDQWSDRRAAAGVGPDSYLATVRKFMVDKGVSEDMTKLITKVDKFTIIPIDNKSRFVIQGVEVYYVDEHGFSSYITTDIALTPPDYNVASSGGGDDEAETESSELSTEDDDTISMSEYVIYVNWKKY